MSHRLDGEGLAEMRRRIVAVLKANQGNMRRSAITMGIQLRALYFRLDRLQEEGMGIDPNDYRPRAYRRENIARDKESECQGAPMKSSSDEKA